MLLVPSNYSQLVSPQTGLLYVSCVLVADGSRKIFVEVGSWARSAVVRNFLAARGGGRICECLVVGFLNVW